MNQDSRLLKWAKQQQRKMDISEGMSTGFRHRSAYHKDFIGYSEIRIPTENGRFRIERVYVAPWYRHDITDTAWILLKIFSAFGDAAAIALFIIAAIADTSWNLSRVTGGIQALAAVSIIIFTARVIILLAVPRNMTISQCNNVDKPFRRWAFISFVMCLVLLIWNIVVLAMNGFGNFAPESVTLWLLIPATLIFLAIWIVHGKIDYISVENNTVVDENSESYVIK